MKIKDLFRYRTIWMGVAILWIMLAHSGFEFQADSILKKVKAFGYGGVDIFVFASGIGCYYSYTKDKSPIDFFKRRIVRLAPSYLLFILVWIIFMSFQNQMGINRIIGNIFGTLYFALPYAAFNWFVGCLLVLYLLTPFFAQFIEKNKLSKNIIFIFIMFLISFSFWGNYDFIIIASRIPIFLIGMLNAKYGNEEISLKYLIIIVALFLIGVCILLLFYRFFNYDDILWNYGLDWYPFILITPFICYLISYIASFLSKTKITNCINSVFTYFGNISFELFLWHIFMFDNVKYYFDDLLLIISSARIIWLIAIFVSIILASLLKKLSNSTRDLVFRP